MGLDATVYCDCFETGRLKELPPNPSVFVSDDGSLDCRGGFYFWGIYEASAGVKA